MKFNKELLKEVLSISTHSRQEGDAIGYIKNWVAVNVPQAKLEQDKYGNIYVTKGDANIYPTFAGHIDTVHQVIKDKRIVEMDDYLYAMDGRLLEQVGTGGDDLVGVYLCLEALRNYDVVKCFFPVEEEIGTVGTSNCNIDWFSNSQYVIQSDRQGNRDIVIVGSGTTLTSKKFNKVARSVGKDYNYELCRDGGLTDVVTLKEMGLDVCVINVASGYWHPHTSQEIVSISDVNNMINFVTNLVDELGSKKWEHQHEQPVYHDIYDDIYSRYHQGTNDLDDEYKFDTNLNEWVMKDNNITYCEDCGKKCTSVHDYEGYLICDECNAWYEAEIS